MDASCKYSCACNDMINHSKYTLSKIQFVLAFQGLSCGWNDSSLMDKYNIVWSVFLYEVLVMFMTKSKDIKLNKSSFTSCGLMTVMSPKISFLQLPPDVFFNLSLGRLVIVSMLEVDPVVDISWSWEERCEEHKSKEGCHKDVIKLSDTYLNYAFKSMHKLRVHEIIDNDQTDHGM